MTQFNDILGKAQDVFDDVFATQTLIEPLVQKEFTDADADRSVSQRKLPAIIALGRGTEKVQVGSMRQFGTPIVSNQCVISYRMDLLGQRDRWPKKGWRITNLENGDVWKVLYSQDDGKHRVDVHCVTE